MILIWQPSTNYCTTDYWHYWLTNFKKTGLDDESARRSVQVTRARWPDWRLNCQSWNLKSGIVVVCCGLWCQWCVSFNWIVLYRIVSMTMTPSLWVWVDLLLVVTAESWMMGFTDLHHIIYNYRVISVTLSRRDSTTMTKKNILNRIESNHSLSHESWLTHDYQIKLDPNRAQTESNYKRR